VSLQDAYGQARRHARFHVAVLPTIVVVAYVGVPHVARIVESMSGYNPGQYEPKDVERQAWLQRAGDSTLFSPLGSQTVVNVALFLLVAVVWLTPVPTRRGRRTPYR
jgi:hypothetical protein